MKVAIVLCAVALACIHAQVNLQLDSDPSKCPRHLAPVPHTSSLCSSCIYMWTVGPKRHSRPIPKPPVHPADPDNSCTEIDDHLGNCVNVRQWVSMASGEASAHKGNLTLSVGSSAHSTGTNGQINAEVHGYKIMAKGTSNSAHKEEFTCMACRNCRYGEGGRSDDSCMLYTLIGAEHNCRVYLDLAFCDTEGNTFLVRYDFQEDSNIWCIEDAETNFFAPTILAPLCVDDDAGYIVVSTCSDRKNTINAIFAVSSSPSDESSTCESDANFAAIEAVVKERFHKYAEGPVTACYTYCAANSTES